MACPVLPGNPASDGLSIHNDLDPGTVTMTQCLLVGLSLMESVTVAPHLLQGDEKIPCSLKMMGDTLNFLDEPDAITFVALGLVVFQSLQFGLHHGTALSLNDGIDGSGVTLQEVYLFHVRLHGRLQNHLLPHLSVIIF
jgi:hypothetical protein